MTARAALVTGASSGIGLAIATVLAEDGYALTITSRRPDKIEAAAESLRAHGVEVHAVAANAAVEEEVATVVREHGDRFERLDVLVNNAGLGIGGEIDGYPTKHIDMQLAVNLRSVVLYYREAMPMLREAGAEHQGAWVFNTSSITGKVGAEWLGVYSATKHGVVGFTQAMNRELADSGIRSCVLCPGYVDTQLSDYIKHEIPGDKMIKSEDIANGVRFVLGTSPNCLVPELTFGRPGDGTV